MQDPLPILLERLAIHRTEKGSPVATARNQVGHQWSRDDQDWQAPLWISLLRTLGQTSAVAFFRGKTLIWHLKPPNPNPNPPTACAQRVAWLARELTGEDIPPELLGNAAVVSALDAALAADLGSAARGAQVEAILGDVALGSSQVRAKAVETLIVERITAAGAKSGSPLLSGYTGTPPRPVRLDHVPRVMGT